MLALHYSVRNSLIDWGIPLIYWAYLGKDHARSNNTQSTWLVQKASHRRAGRVATINDWAPRKRRSQESWRPFLPTGLIEWNLGPVGSESRPEQEILSAKLPCSCHVHILRRRRTFSLWYLMKNQIQSTIFQATRCSCYRGLRWLHNLRSTFHQPEISTVGHDGRHRI